MLARNSPQMVTTKLLLETEFINTRITLNIAHRNGRCLHYAEQKNYATVKKKEGKSHPSLKQVNVKPLRLITRSPSWLRFSLYVLSIVSFEVLTFQFLFPIYKNNDAWHAHTPSIAYILRFPLTTWKSPPFLILEYLSIRSLTDHENPIILR